MTLTLRHRVILTIFPILVLLAVLGGAGAVLLYRLGGSIDAILRENYESVIAMERLNEALERIDSSFQFALAGRGQKNPQAYETKARTQFESNWKQFGDALRKEQENITIHPTEDEYVARLETLTERYRQQGKAFYARSTEAPERHADYFGPQGLEARFLEIKQTANDILQLNHANMKEASRKAQQTALDSLIWFGTGLVVAAVLASLLAWHTIRTILRPIQAMTQSALGISAGNLDQVVPYLAPDELGQFAQAFNQMARHLRAYRQSHSTQLLRAQQTSQATIDSFPDAVLVVNAEGGVEMANPAARRLLGIMPREPRQALAGTWHPPEPLRQPLQDALQGRRNYLPEGFDQAIVLGSDGREHALLPRILTIHDPFGNTLGAAVLLQDVTRYRLLDQFKSDLVATVSHELKTPLTSLRLDLHLVLEETLGPLSPKQLELLLDARDNAERMLAIVNNLLDFARLEQRREYLDIRPESPAELVRSAADAVRPRAEDKGLELVVDVPADLPPVAVDGQRLGHALANLLDNALTYTDRGGRITLSAAQAEDRITITVADTGAGIAPEHMPHLFERFFRVPGQSRGQGTGLGLAIVREIVTAHGGEVTCESSPGTGTVMRLSVPIWKDESRQASS